MKLSLLILLFALTPTASFSQSLIGEWNGYFTYSDAISIPAVPIRLKITMNKDRSYTVYSYTPADENKKGEYDTIICRMTYKMIGPDSVYFEETNVIKVKTKGLPCFQGMYLKIERSGHDIKMNGVWGSVPKEKGCMANGPISFIKRQ